MGPDGSPPGGEHLEDAGQLWACEWLWGRSGIATTLRKGCWGPGTLAADLPTNVVFGGLYATAVMGLSWEALRIRSRLGLRGLTPAGSVMVGAVPLALLLGVRMILSGVL